MSQHVWSVFQRRSRHALLQIIDAEARGEDAWDPTVVFEYRRERRMSEAAQRAWPKLKKAVAKLTDAAIAAGRLDLVHDVDEWYEMVVAHMEATTGVFLRRRARERLGGQDAWCRSPTAATRLRTSCSPRAGAHRARANHLPKTVRTEPLTILRLVQQHGEPHGRVIARAVVVVPDEIRKPAADRKHSVGPRAASVDLLAQCRVPGHHFREATQSLSQVGPLIGRPVLSQPSHSCLDVIAEAAV